MLMLQYVTLYTEEYSSMVMAPQNFFDRAQDGDLLNRRWIEIEADSGELSFGNCQHMRQRPFCHRVGVNVESEGIHCQCNGG